MAYRLKRGEPLTEALRRIVREQLGAALDELGDAELDVHETIHQTRKRCKKARAALRLVRPGLKRYPEANARLRDAARLLAAPRDAQSHLEALDALAGHYEGLLAPEALAPVRAGLEAHRAGLSGPDSDIALRMAEVAGQLHRAREAAAAWRVKGPRYEVLAGGLAASYGRGRRARAEAYERPSSERFHEWRKRAKYHRYHVRLLATAWPEVLDPTREALHDLTDLLGEAHDLAVLRARLVADPVAFGGYRPVQVVSALADARRAELRARARGLGARVFAEPKKRAGQRFAAYVRAWDEERPPGFAADDDLVG